MGGGGAGGGGSGGGGGSDRKRGNDNRGYNSPAARAHRQGFRGTSAFGGAFSGGNIGQKGSPSYGQGTHCL